MSRITKAITLVALAALSSAALARVSDDRIHITVMTDMSSDLSDAAGQGSVIAAELAVADSTTRLAAIEVDSADDKRSARAARGIASRYLESGTDLFVDLAGDSAAEAIQQVAGHGDAVVMAVGAASQQLTGSYCGRTAFHWSPDLSVMMRLTDLDKRRDRRRGTMFVYGGGRRDALRSTYEMGNAMWGRNIAGQLFVTDIRHLGLYATNGMTIMSPYYWDADDSSRAFAERFQARYGAPPTYIQAGVYSAVSHYLKGVAEAGSDDPEAVARAMRSIKPDDFYARNASIRDDGQLVQDVYLLQVKEPRQSEGSWDYLRIVKTFSGDGIYTPLKYSGCPRLNTITAARSGSENRP